MFRHLFLHEIRLFRHHAAWWASLLVLSALTVLAAWNGLSRAAERDATIGTLRAESQLIRATLQTQLEKFAAGSGATAPAAANPGAMGFSVLITPVSLPATSLAPLALGQSDLLASHYGVTAHAPYTFMNETEITNPHNVLAGSFDVAFVMVFVLPIFIIALTFDLLSREKERGMLGLTLAHGVPLPRYTLAKCVARATILLAVTVAVTVLGFLIVGVDFTDDAALRDMALWSGMVILYALFWFALGLFVNALDRSSETNGVLMANVWLVAVVVLPAFVNVLATSVFPAPSRVELTTELREAASEAEERAADAREQYLYDHPELTGLDRAPAAFFREVLTSETAIAATIEPLMKAFEDQAERRAQMVGALQYLSPAILAQQAFSALAGTDDRRYRDFREQATAFHRDYQAFFATRLLLDQAITRSDMDAIPEFVFEESEHHRRTVGGPALMLALLTVSMGLAALHSYRRYGVLQPA
jgi:ABC-2 type transport system permease protein